MQSRPPTIRDMPPPPNIVGLQHFTTYAEIDEIQRSTRPPRSAPAAPSATSG